MPHPWFASLAVDICYDVYLHPLTRAIVPADQPLPTDAIQQDAKKGDEGARKAKGGASRKGEPSHTPPSPRHPMPTHALHERRPCAGLAVLALCSGSASSHPHFCALGSLFRISGGSNKGENERGVMMVQKVGTAIHTPIKMTLMPDGRITGTFGSGSVSANSDNMNVPVSLTDGEPSVRRKKLAIGQRFFKTKDAPDGLFVFRGYNPDTPH